jgi:predicted RNA-binding protein with RPS1 domain
MDNGREFDDRTTVLDRVVRTVRIGHLVLCREVSGYDCDQRMTRNADHCGNPDHVSQFDPDNARFPAKSMTHRASVSCQEGIATDGVFALAKFNTNAVTFSRNIQEQFTSYHGVEPGEAVTNLTLVISQSVSTGEPLRVEGGRWKFEWRGYVVFTSPDLKAAVQYRTRHFGRTPQQLVAGLPGTPISGARQHPNRRKYSETRWQHATESLSVGQHCSGVIANVVNFGVFVTLPTVGDDEIEGLIHKSVFPFGFEECKRDTFIVGSCLQVVVCKIDPSSQRIELGVDLPSPAATTKPVSEVKVSKGSESPRKFVPSDESIMRAADSYNVSLRMLLAITKTSAPSEALLIADEATKRLGQAPLSRVNEHRQKPKPKSTEPAQPSEARSQLPKPKGPRKPRSVWTVSGGLPGLGKRH